MQEMQLSTDGSAFDFGLSWWIGENDFGNYIYHSGSGAAFENTMVFYPDLDLGVVVISNVEGYHHDRIVQGLVSAWMHRK